MNGERMFEIMGKISDEYVSEASMVKNGRKKGWVKWAAAAAALALAVGIGAARLTRRAPTELGTLDGGLGAGGGDFGAIEPGGLSDGADGVNCSVAVHPAGVSEADVSEAVILPLTEAEARAVDPLGGFIPSDPPAGLTLLGVSEYRTTMKDGTVYRMLRVNYTDGEPMPAINDGGETTQSYVVTFSMSIWSFRPDTDAPIYSPDDATAELFADDPDTVHLDFGGVFVSLHPDSQTPEELLEIVDAIGK